MPSAKNQQRDLLTFFLKEVPQKSWGSESFVGAAMASGLGEGAAYFRYPKGELAMADVFADYIRTAVTNEVDKTRSFARMKVREKIAFQLHAWLDAMMPYKKAIPHLLRFYARPSVAPLALRHLHLLVDEMWHQAGDTSTDYNYYSKRLLLAGIVKTTMLYWLQDESREAEDTRAFLEARIANILVIGKVLGTLKTWRPEDLPHLAGLAGQAMRFFTAKRAASS
jgi:ubiquinone biosynthesis protein COQ9